MLSQVLFTNKREINSAIQELKSQKDRLELEPDLVLVYCTLKYHGNYQKILDELHSFFGDVPMAGSTADAFVFPHEIRSDGIAVVVCEDRDARIETLYEKDGTARERGRKLAEKIRCEDGVVILHVPVVRVPGRFEVMNILARGIYYSLRCRMNKKMAKEYARAFAKYLYEVNLFNLPQHILKEFSERHPEIPVAGVNVLHNQVKLDSPNVFCNWKDLGNAISAVVIEKGGIEFHYDDIFPEKGDTPEETFEIVRNMKGILREAKAEFVDNILISIDGRPPQEVLKELTGVKKPEENEFVGKLEKGKFEVQMPYTIQFISKKTAGSFHMGCASYYPFDLYPILFDTDELDDRIFLGYEPFYGRMSEFVKTVEEIKDPSKFNFILLDVSSIMAFGEYAYGYRDVIRERCKSNYFGIFSSAPFAHIPEKFKKRKYLPEVEDNIYFTAGGVNITLGL